MKNLLIQRISTLIIAVSLMVIALVALTPPSPAHAIGDAAKSSACSSIGGCAGGEKKINKVIKFVINGFSVVVGIIAVIMVIVGGLKFITSGGDSNKVSSARSSILYAVIGLIVVALAQVIVRFVLQKV